MDRQKRNQIREAFDEQAAGGTDRLVVGRIMTSTPTCTSPDASVLDLVRTFHRHGYRHLLVIEGEKLVGVISDLDVVRCFGPGKYPKEEVLASIPARDIMSQDVISVGPECPVARAATLMVENGISCLPVVHRERVCGIVTDTDLHVVLEILLESPRPASNKPKAFAGLA